MIRLCNGFWVKCEWMRWKFFIIPKKSTFSWVAKSDTTRHDYNTKADDDDDEEWKRERERKKSSMNTPLNSTWKKCENENNSLCSPLLLLLDHRTTTTTTHNKKNTKIVGDVNYLWLIFRTFHNGIFSLLCFIYYLLRSRELWIVLH